jgi:replicative DNA helicase
MTFDTDELERRIIGSVVSDPSLIDRIERIRFEDIEDPDCRDVLAALRGLSKDRTRITADTIAGSCIGTTAETIRRLAGIGTLNVDRLAEAVEALIDHKRTRMLKADLSESLGKLNNGQSWRETVADIGTKLISGYDTHRSRSGQDVRADVVRRLRMGSAARLPTGIAAIDAHFHGGLPPGYLIGLGAQTKTGKTTLIATISGEWDEMKIPHLLHSLERHDSHIESLKVARRLGVNMNALDDHIDRIEADTSRSATQYVHDTRLTVEDWRHDVLYHVRRNGVRAAMVDYWQLFGASPKHRRNETRENELNRTVQIIANTAVDAGIPIILMSQNNDAGDPKDCKAIKQAAGYYGVIHRDQDSDATWIETIATTVSPMTDIGSHAQPALSLETGIGPYFRSVL